MAALPQQDGLVTATDSANIQLLGPVDKTLRLGSSVDYAGDVNGDGFGDVVVAARGTGSDGAGAWVFYGPLEPNAVQLPPDGSVARGFRIISPSGSNLYAGRVVAGLGDVNGDGYDDVAIGANGIGTNVGGAFVIFGSPAGSDVTLNPAGLPPAAGFMIKGAKAVDNAGSSLAGGDINGDGYSDVLIGSSGYDAPATANSGAAYVIYGKPGPATTVQLGTFGAGQGFMITGAGLNDYLTGVSSAGDVNGDGYEDVLVGASGSYLTSTVAGYAAVVYGGPAAGDVTLSRTGIPADTGFVINAPAAGDDTGAAVSTAGDLDGDGYADIVIGAPRGVVDGAATGLAWVIYGRDQAGTVNLTTSGLPAGEGFRIRAPGSAYGASEVGYAVSGGTDLDGDGYDDAVIAAPRVGHLTGSGSQANVGEVAVIFGGPDRRTGTLTLPLTNAAMDPGDGFVLRGPGRDSFFGHALDSPMTGHTVSSRGDINGDDRPDLLAGAGNYRDRDGLVVGALGYGEPALGYPAGVQGQAGKPFILVPNLVKHTGSGSFTVTPELPAGLAIDSGTGTIEGVPEVEVDSYTGSVAMTDLAGEASAPVAFSISAAEPDDPGGPDGPGGPDDSGGPDHPADPPGPARLKVTGFMARPRTLRLTGRNGRFRRLTLRFRANRPAAARIVFKRKVHSHFRRTARLRLGRRSAGRNRVILHGRVGRRNLRPGSYRLVLVARAGGKTVRRITRIRVLKPRRR